MASWSQICIALDLGVVTALDAGYICSKIGKCGTAYTGPGSVPRITDALFGYPYACTSSTVVTILGVCLKPG
jgi:hypothetical protein